MEFLGIDFSGNAASWKAGFSRSNVWICRVEAVHNRTPQVVELQMVQQLPGASTPYEKLAELLANKQFGAAAIDAPFSIPQRHVPTGGWLDLLKKVDALDLVGNAPFPRGGALIQLAKSIAELDS